MSARRTDQTDAPSAPPQDAAVDSATQYLPGDARRAAEEEVAGVSNELLETRIETRIETRMETRLTERLAPIERHLADIAARLGAGGASSVRDGTTPTDGATSSRHATADPPPTTPSSGTPYPKLEAEPRSPEPAEFKERWLEKPGEWTFDLSNPTPYIPPANQGSPIPIYL